jgi:hypothetical protein
VLKLWLYDVNWPSEQHSLTFLPTAGDAVAFGGLDQTIPIKNLQDGSCKSVKTPHPSNAIASSKQFLHA